MFVMLFIVFSYAFFISFIAFWYVFRVLFALFVNVFSYFGGFLYLSVLYSVL